MRHSGPAWVESSAGSLRRRCSALRGNPDAYAVEDDPAVRYCPLHRFPYTLVYVELDERIWVAALAHQAAAPSLLGWPPTRLSRSIAENAVRDVCHMVCGRLA